MLENYYKNVGEAIKIISKGFLKIMTVILCIVMIIFIVTASSMGNGIFLIIYILLLPIILFSIFLTSLFCYAFGCLTQDINEIKKKICSIEQKENKANNNVENK